MNNQFDPMTEEFHEDYSPDSKTILSSLDGSVQSQGVKVSHREWLDMGYEEWNKIPDKIKAAAYQASQITGWDINQICSLMVSTYPHIKESTMKMTIDHLQSLVKQHPLDVEVVYEREIGHIPINRSRKNNDISIAEAKD